MERRLLLLLLSIICLELEGATSILARPFEYSPGGRYVIWTPWGGLVHILSTGHPESESKTLTSLRLHWSLTSSVSQRSLGWRQCTKSLHEGWWEKSASATRLCLSPACSQCFFALLAGLLRSCYCSSCMIPNGANFEPMRSASAQYRQDSLFYFLYGFVQSSSFSRLRAGLEKQQVLPVMKSHFRCSLLCRQSCSALLLRRPKPRSPLRSRSCLLTIFSSLFAFTRQRHSRWSD